MSMESIDDLSDMLKLNIVVGLKMLKDHGISDDAILRSAYTFNKEITNTALKINNNREDINMVNIDIIIATLVLIYKLGVIDKVTEDISNQLGINRKLFDSEINQFLNSELMKLAKKDIY